jgi:hypothetical protein
VWVPFAVIEPGAQRHHGGPLAIVVDKPVSVQGAEQYFLDVGTINPTGPHHATHPVGKRIRQIVAAPWHRGGQLHYTSVQGSLRVGPLTDAGSATVLPPMLLLTTLAAGLDQLDDRLWNVRDLASTMGSQEIRCLGKPAITLAARHRGARSDNESADCADIDAGRQVAFDIGELVAIPAEVGVNTAARCRHDRRRTR